jgi:mannose-1-phosphate guanylyltransferase
VLSALVLTAGLGTRLDPLTRLLAKAAMPVAGRTLIERVLDWLRAEGVTDVVLNLHHHPETITAVVGDGAQLGLRVRYSWEHPILGSAGGPRHALPLLDAETFLIINGDTLCDVDLAPMIEAHAGTRAAVTLAVVPNPAPDHYNGIRLDDEQRITAFVPKGVADPTWHFVGIQVVSAEIFAPLPDAVPAETVGGIYRERLTTQFGSLRGWPVSKRFVDVGTPRDYLRTVLEHRTPGAVDAAIEGDGSQIHPTARLTRSVIWREARIESHAALEECIVAGAVTVPAGFTARESVLMPAAFVRPGEAVRTVGDMAVFPL